MIAPPPPSRPAGDLTPITLISDARPYGSKRRKTAGGAYQGSAMADQPPEDGTGNRPAPRRMPLDNQLTSRADGHVKRRAAAKSLAPWRTCRNTGWERDGGTRSPTGPQVREIHRHRPTLRVVGTFHVCSNKAANSDLSCFLYRGRLKRLHLHCQADAVA